MKQRYEIILEKDEYATVLNTVGSQRRHLEQLADKLLKEDITKERIADYLYGMASELSVAENVLTNMS